MTVLFCNFFGVYVRERYDQSFKSQEMGHIQMYLSQSKIQTF